MHFQLNLFIICNLCLSIQNSIYIFSFSFSIWFLLDDNKDKIIFDFSSLLIDLILPLLVLGKSSFSFVFILSFFNNIFGRISLIIFTSSSEIEKFSRLLFCSLFIWLKVFIFFESFIEFLWDKSELSKLFSDVAL